MKGSGYEKRKKIESPRRERSPNPRTVKTKLDVDEGEKAQAQAEDEKQSEIAVRPDGTFFCAESESFGA